jgi:hypothetical protein
MRHTHDTTFSENILEFFKILEDGWGPYIINILPLVEGVMVDYHTRGKYHTGKRISPETKSRVIFFFQSVILFSRVWSSTINTLN